jgi:hypothetical protein
VLRGQHLAVAGRGAGAEALHCLEDQHVATRERLGVCAIASPTTPAPTTMVSTLAMRPPVHDRSIGGIHSGRDVL